MKDFIRMTAVALLLVSASPAQMNLEALAKQADAVVVARASGVIARPNGADFRLTVLRALHGEVLAGSNLDVTTRLRREGRADPSRETIPECALVLLKRTAAGWEALGSEDSPFLKDSMIALAGCEADAPSLAEGATVFEKCFAEAALSASRSPGLRTAPRLFDLAGASDSPLVGRIMREVSSSSEPRLRADGLAWRVRRGDPDAVVQMAGLVLSDAQADAVSVFSPAVFDYANTDAKGIAALGLLVSNSGFRNEYMKRGAAHSLRNIHTSEAVPFLAGMLDSSDPEMLMEAVSGLTEHVMGVSVVPDGPKKQNALDEVFNPARKKTPSFGVEQQYLHMGFFRDKEEETRIVTYWLQWWQANRALFSAAP